MSMKNKILNSLKSFGKDRGGNVFMITGLTAFVVFSSAGAAIDYTRISNTKSKMTNALDAAVLATGVELTNGEENEDKLKDVFENFFYANIDGARENREDYRRALPVLPTSRSHTGR